MRKLSILILVNSILVISLWLSFKSHAMTGQTNLPQMSQRPTQETSSVIKDNKILVRRSGGPGQVEFIPGEVLVKFKDPNYAEEVTMGRKTARGAILLSVSSGLTEIFDRFAVTEVERPFANFKSPSHSQVVKLISPSLRDNPEQTKALVSELQKEPEVEYAELNLIMRTQAAPNDPYYSSSGAWGQGFRDLWGLQKISAETAWNSTKGNNIVVAAIDTGVDYNHEDIAANIRLNAGETGTDTSGHDKRSNGVDDDGNGFIDDWHGWDFVTIDGSPADNDPMDDFGHGTHVAGTIAAVGGNGIGIIGVAPAAKIMPLKGLDSIGSGSTEDLAKAILYAADNGAQVINASWGGFASAPVQTFINAIAYAHDTKGVVFVAAAGNDNYDVGNQEVGFTPANIRDVIAVSAFDHTDSKAYFSNYGRKIDVAAPGGGDADPTGTVAQPERSILSLLSSVANPSMTDSGQLIVGGKYLRQAGTSMASPHAAGVAALIRARHPAYSPEQVRQALRHGSDDVGESGFDLNSGYGRINATKALTVSSPLAVQLTEPNGTLISLTQVSVRGTAAGVGLANWRLEYGAGSSPTNWTQIASSTAQVVEGQLAVWNLATIADGNYTLHLIAQNSSGKFYEDSLPVIIDNVLITEPPLNPNTIFRSGQVISVKGYVTPQNFSSYTINILDSTNSVLTNAAVTLTNGGLQKVRNGLLGTWNTTGVPADSYTIKLIVYLTDGSTIEENARVIVDPTIHPGWPRNLYPTDEGGGFGLALTDHLDVQDINGDGAKDILVGYGNSVRIYDHSGESLPGWPQRIDSISSDAVIQKSPAVGDLTGDGSPEVVATGDFSHIFIWHADGTPLPGWPMHVGGEIHSLAIADVNNDGANEIIATGGQGNIMVFDKDGAYLPGWPQSAGFGNLTPASIGDMDGDGQKEIVVATDFSPRKLYIFRSNGTIMPGWPKAINTYSGCYPALGDLDGNGDLEVVIGTEDGKVYAFHHNGALVAGWPQRTKATEVHSPAVGDIDGDGKAEVVAGNRRVTENNKRFNYLYAWHGNGTLLSGWPVKVEITCHCAFGFGAPVLADVDGDGVPDIVASSDGLYLVVRAYKIDGSAVSGFPKPALKPGAGPANTVAIADLDNDGLLEMAWIDLDLNAYIWDLPAPSSAPAPWPMFHHDARHSGAGIARAKHSISGQVKLGAGGLGGVTMTLTSTTAGFAPRTVTTASNGAYSFANLPADNAYTVRPSKLGYLFTPISRTYSNLSRNQTGANFTARAAQFDVGGKVMIGSTGLGGITVTLSGSRTATATTLNDGSYKFANLPAGGTYTVKPSKPGYSFTPTDRTYSNLAANKTGANFSANPTFNIGGQVKVGTVGLSNVTITLSSPSPAGFAPRTTTTYASGNYLFAGLPAGRTYIIRPSKTNYTFTPVSRTYSNLSANQTTVNFTATLKSYSISGKVAKAGTTAGVGGVTMTLTSPTPAGFAARTVLTYASGNYTFTGLPAGRNYTLKPTKSGFTFSPVMRTITNLSANQPIGPSTSFIGTQ